jgi:iron complex outermembrane receptor protein
MAAPAQGGSPGMVVGSVVARETGQPVANAAITLEGSAATTSTNAMGQFTLTGVPDGAVAIVVEAPGFLAERVPGIMERASQGASLIVELTPTPNFLERVQVTATKTPLSVGEVAAQTDIVERTTFEARGDQTLTQAIAHVPGALISTQLGLFESVTLRGMPRDGLEFTNTLLLVDGVPQANSNNAARVVALPINDASRIEIVRGPNSALYGRTAIGGAVNLRTADPTPDHQLAIDLTGGEFEMLKGVARASGPVQQWGGYYVSMARERDSAYFNLRTTDEYSVGNWAGFGKLTFAPDARSFGSFSLHRVVSDNSTPTNEPVINGRLLHEIEPRFERLTSFNIPGPNYSQGETRATFNYTRQVASWAHLVEVFGYRDVRHEFINDGDFIGAPYDLAAHTITQYPFSQKLEEDIFYQELRLELTPQPGILENQLIFGGSFEWNSGSLASDFIYTDEDLFGWTIDYLNPIIPPESEWQHDRSSRAYHLLNTALFAQYLLEPSARFLVSAGGRYDRLDLDNTREGRPTVEASFDAFSPKLSATYRLTAPSRADGPAVNVYGAYSHAFLPPRRPSALVPEDVPLNLRPEDIDNYEAGVKSSLLENRLGIEASYFWMKEDGVVLTTRQGPFFLPTNAGEQRYKGVEAGLRFDATPMISTYVNASFYHNRFGQFVIQSEDGDEVLTGHRLPISPDRVINWGASVRPVSSVDATLKVKHIGDVQTNRENTFALDAYTIVDGAISWRRGSLRITLSAHNLLNTEYYWNGDGETADPGRPRQVLVTTSVVLR